MTIYRGRQLIYNSGYAVMPGGLQACWNTAYLDKKSLRIISNSRNDEQYHKKTYKNTRTDTKYYKLCCVMVCTHFTLYARIA